MILVSEKHSSSVGYRLFTLAGSIPSRSCCFYLIFFSGEILGTACSGGIRRCSDIRFCFCNPTGSFRAFFLKEGSEGCSLLCRCGWCNSCLFKGDLVMILWMRLPDSTGWCLRSFFLKKKKKLCWAICLSNFLIVADVQPITVPSKV